MSYNETPREFLRRFGPLPDAVSPLADLARLQPQMITQVIELAMVMGIHAQERAQERMERDEKAASLFGGTRPFWRP